jgi:hypothetical protein
MNYIKRLLAIFLVAGTLSLSSFAQPNIAVRAAQGVEKVGKATAILGFTIFVTDVARVLRFGDVHPTLSYLGLSYIFPGLDVTFGQMFSNITEIASRTITQNVLWNYGLNPSYNYAVANAAAGLNAFYASLPFSLAPLVIVPAVGLMATGFTLRKIAEATIPNAQNP